MYNQAHIFTLVEKLMNPKLKIVDIVRISKYNNIFAKAYAPNWSEEVFVIRKVKNTVPWTYVISDLKGEIIVGTLYDKGLQKNKLKTVQNWKNNLKR